MNRLVFNSSPYKESEMKSRIKRSLFTTLACCCVVLTGCATPPVIFTDGTSLAGKAYVLYPGPRQSKSNVARIQMEGDFRALSMDDVSISKNAAAPAWHWIHDGHPAEILPGPMAIELALPYRVSQGEVAERMQTPDAPLEYSSESITVRFNASKGHRYTVRTRWYGVLRSRAQMYEWAVLDTTTGVTVASGREEHLVEKGGAANR